jgi:hypothetical protein
LIIKEDSKLKTFFKARLIQITIALFLVIVLVVGTSVTAMAQENNQGNTATFRSIQMSTIKGKVSEPAPVGNTFVVTRNDNTTVTITTDENTKYYKVQAGPYAIRPVGIMQQRVKDFKDNKPNNFNQRGMGDNDLQDEPPASNDDEVDTALDNLELEQGLSRNWQGPQGIFDRFKSWFGSWRGFGENAAFTDITVGDGIIVRTMPNETLAKQVLIIKPSNIKKISGKISNVGVSTFTVIPADTSVIPIVLTIDKNTSVSFKGAIGMVADQWATVVYKVQSTGNLAITVNVALEEPNKGHSTTTSTTS